MPWLTQWLFRTLPTGPLWNPNPYRVSARQGWRWASLEVSVHVPFDLSFSGRVFIEPFPCGASENRLGAISVIADSWALPGSEEPAAPEEEEGPCVCKKLSCSSEAADV